MILPSPAFTPAQQSRPVAADAFRVLAIGMVGWFHIWQQSWQGAGRFTYLALSGAAWVDGLIMLSAFCLFLPYANLRAQKAAFPGVDAAEFYRRRAIRILPSYNVCILVCLVVTLCTKGADGWLWKDLAAHLTFTQSWFPFSSLYTNLGGTTWTLTLFAWFYLVFPLLAKVMYLAPVCTGTALFAVQLLWRQATVPLYGTLAYNMRFNQLPAFASALALGMWGALLFAALSHSSWMQNWFARLLGTAGGCGALWLVSRLLQALNHSPDYQLWQLENRTTLVFCMTLALVGFSLGIPLPGARLCGFLSAISYNFYLWHQTLTVWLKYQLHLPAWQGEVPPNQLGDTAWMARSSLFYWAAALLAAVLMTWLVEKPCVQIAKNFRKKPNNSGIFSGKVV